MCTDGVDDCCGGGLSVQRAIKAALKSAELGARALVVLVYR